jgi:hypothetical protein
LTWWRQGWAGVWISLWFEHSCLPMPDSAIDPQFYGALRVEAARMRVLVSG